jgi:nucleoside-diphosphate-sugar epimerase
MVQKVDRGTALSANGLSGERLPDEAIRKVVVSGGNGFIGSSLVRRLVGRGIEVHALANENHQRLDRMLPSQQIHVVTGDASQASEFVLAIQPDVIFHLAAVYSEPHSIECIQSMIQGNMLLGVSMLFAASRCDRVPAFINTGTYWQFGATGAYAPNTLYAATKQAFQDILQFYRTRLPVRSTTLMLYDTFGPSDQRPKLWNRLAAATRGQHIPLSPGDQTIQLVHIEDTVDAFLQAAIALHRGDRLDEVYAVRPEWCPTLRELVDRFNQASGLELDLGWGELPYWEGQVFTPWRGATLPGWSVRRDVVQDLLALIDGVPAGNEAGGA